MAECAECDPTKWHREYGSYQARKWKQEERSIARWDVPILRHKCHRVGTQAEISGVTKCNIAGVARKDVPSCCGHRKKNSKDCDDGNGRIRKHERKRDEYS